MIYRYEIKDGKLKQKVLPLGEYNVEKEQYEKLITFDWMKISSEKVAVCLGFAKSDLNYRNLITNFEDYCFEISRILVANRICSSFEDIDFYLMNYAENFKINKIEIANDVVSDWHGENTIFKV